MADQTFTNGVTLTDAGWFNDANTVTYKGATDKILVGGGVGTVASWTTATGTGAPVRATSPTLVTPTLGVASATSVNKVTLTAPATGSTITVLDGKTFTLNNTITFAGTDSTTMTFPTTSATLARTDAANTFTGHQTIEGVTSTGATGTGNFVFSVSPTLTGTPVINTTASVGGAWTAAATWTLPALTLGGTVSGGGNQINNVIIGTSNPLAGSFTTGNFSSTLTLSGTAANIATGANYISYGGTDAGLSFDSSNNATLSAALTSTGTQAVASTAPTMVLKRTNSATAFGSFNFSGSDDVVDWQISTNNTAANAFEINEGNGANNRFRIASGGAVTIPGSLSKGSGTFRIPHPLPSKTATHQLVHSFIEGPRVDLIYRGIVRLIDGKAQVNIDKEATMTEGTFEVLCREVQSVVTNATDWTPVRSKVIGNMLYIEANDTTSTADVNWIVIGERKDKHIMTTDWTDENGKPIVEPLLEVK